MEFIEQPLSYDDARLGLQKFEQKYNKTSAEVFSGHSQAFLEINPDVLFEWKSYYEFMCEVDRRLAARVAERFQLHVEEVVYTSSSGNRSQHRSSEQKTRASLCIAA